MRILTLGAAGVGSAAAGVLAYPPFATHVVARQFKAQGGDAVHFMDMWRPAFSITPTDPMPILNTESDEYERQRNETGL